MAFTPVVQRRGAHDVVMLAIAFINAQKGDGVEAGHMPPPLPGLHQKALGFQFGQRLG